MNKNIGHSIALAVSLLATTAQAQSVTKAPVLMELFTSQGCSSCPPAEAVLNDWGMAMFKAHKALPLAFHVDYWDYLGWKDPFSSNLASDRQRDYGAFFRSNSIYTPQLVVNGQVGFNGADQSRAESEMDQASSNLTFPIGITCGLLPKSIQVQLALSKEIKNSDLLYIAIFENNLKTHVERGENGGRDLEENFVVRNLQVIPASELNHSNHWKLSLVRGKDWKTKDCGVAAWLQDPKTHQVSGLNWAYPLVKSVPNELEGQHAQDQGHDDHRQGLR